MLLNLDIHENQIWGTGREGIYIVWHHGLHSLSHLGLLGQCREYNHPNVPDKGNEALNMCKILM